MVVLKYWKEWWGATWKDELEVEKWVGFNILVLGMLELVNLGGYGWEGEEMKVSADMGKKKKKNR